jgi:hypothetical protein
MAYVALKGRSSAAAQQSVGKVKTQTSGLKPTIKKGTYRRVNRCAS